jgi:hypothetical protein
MSTKLHDLKMNYEGEIFLFAARPSFRRHFRSYDALKRFYNEYPGTTAIA